MAEPLRKPGNIPPKNNVRLKLVENSDSTPPRRINHLRAVNQQESNPQKAQQGSVSEREESPSNVIQGPWKLNRTAAVDAKQTTKSKGNVKGKKGWLIGGGIGIGTVITQGILVLLFPMKLEAYIQNITNLADRIPGYATEQRIEHLVTRFLATRLILAAHPTKTENSLVFCTNGNVACTLFHTYTTKYFETKLGIDMHVDNSGVASLGGRASGWKVTIPASETNVDSVAQIIETKSNKEMKKIISNHVEERGTNHSFISRFLAKKLLQKKYGVSFWRGPPFVEKAVNAYDEARSNIKTGIYKATIGKISPKLATYLACLQGSFDVCSKLHDYYANTPTAVPADPPKDPATQQNVDTNSSAYKDAKAAYDQAKVAYDAQITAQQALSAVDVPTTDVGTAVTKGLISKRIFAIAGGGVAAAGILDMIFEAIYGIQNGAIESISYDIATQTYTGFSTEIITAIEKMKAGDLDANTLQAVSTLFDGSDQAPLQQAESGLSVDTSKGITTNCSSGSGADVATKLAPGELVCPTQKVVRNYTSALDANPAWAALATTATGWHNSAHTVINFANGIVGDVLTAIPGYTNLMSFVGSTITNVAGDQIKSAMQWIIGIIFDPPTVGSEATGVQNYVGVSAGIRTTENGLMEQGVDTTDGTALGGGGSVLSNQQVATITGQQDASDKQYFNGQPLLARIFDVNLSGSFVQQLLLKTPNSIGSLAKLPFTALSQTLSGVSASAASTTTSVANPFGLSIYGYAADDPALSADPSIYTPDYCAQTAKTREDSYRKDPGENVATYHVSDPCALEKMAVGSALNAEGITDDPYSLKTVDGGGSSQTDTSQTASADPLIAAVVNKKHPNSPVDYAPTDLVDVGGGQTLRAEAATAFKSMQSAGNAQGMTLLDAFSGYRSYQTQVSTYANWVKSDGSAAKADTHSARPGYSEHQTGLAIDIHTAGPDPAFATTDSGKWLAANSWKYGFILRYPDGKQSVTGYIFEPWHYRYIGVTAATDMHNKSITTLEEYYNVTGGEYLAYSPSNSPLIAMISTSQNKLINTSLPSTALSMEPWLV